MSNSTILVLNKSIKRFFYFKYIHKSTSFHYKETQGTKRPYNFNLCSFSIVTYERIEKYLPRTDSMITSGCSLQYSTNCLHFVLLYKIKAVTGLLKFSGLIIALYPSIIFFSSSFFTLSLTAWVDKPTSFPNCVTDKRAFSCRCSNIFLSISSIKHTPL